MNSAQAPRGPLPGEAKLPPAVRWVATSLAVLVMRAQSQGFAVPENIVMALLVTAARLSERHRRNPAELVALMRNGVQKGEELLAEDVSVASWLQHAVNLLKDIAHIACVRNGNASIYPILSPALHLSYPFSSSL